MGKLYINYEDVEEAKEQIASAVDVFSSVIDKGFADEIAILDEMDSDFTDRLKTILKKFQKNQLKDLKSNFEDLTSDVQDCCDEFQEQEKILVSGGAENGAAV